MSDYSELKKLAEAATQGPWGYDGSYVCPSRVEGGTTYVESWRSVADCAQPENTKFIAAANPAAVLQLLDNLESAQKKIDQAWNRSTPALDGYIPGALDAWKRPVKQHLPYDFSGNPGASATQYCNGWNDSGGYWKNHCSDLQAQIAGFKTGYEAYEQVVQGLKAENELARMRIKELDLLFGRYILAMRAAVIEEEHGNGRARAMEWIYNSLAGPGELPPEDETDAQAYFDREIVAVDDGMQEVMAFHEGRRADVSKENSHG